MSVPGQPDESVFVVVVRFRVRPETVDEVRTEIARNAEASAAERGCHGFTVLVDQDDPASFLLHEQYQDETAFQIGHRATDHYERWKAVEGRCVVAGSRTVQFLRPLAQEAAQ